MKNPIAILFLGSLMVSAASAQTATPTSAAPHPLSPPVASANSLSPTEWQELRLASQEAIKANPDLVKKAAQMSQRMHAFQEKLDAAMIKADPQVAAIVAQLEQRSHGQQPVAANPNAK